MMQLCYCGIKYQAKILAINIIETEMIAKFLGSTGIAVVNATGSVMVRKINSLR